MKGMELLMLILVILPPGISPLDIQVPVTDGFQKVGKKNKRIRASYDVFGHLLKNKTFRTLPLPGRNPPIAQSSGTNLAGTKNAPAKDVSSDSSGNASEENRFSPLYDPIESPIEAFNSSTSEGRAMLLQQHYNNLKEVALLSTRDQVDGISASSSSDGEEDTCSQKSGDSTTREDALLPSYMNVRRKNGVTLMSEPYFLQERRRRSLDGANHVPMNESEDNFDDEAKEQSDTTMKYTPLSTDPVDQREEEVVQAPLPIQTSFSMVMLSLLVFVTLY